MSDSSQLLQCLRASLENAVKTGDDSLRKTLLGSSIAVVNELLLRADIQGEQQHLMRGQALLHSAVELTPELESVPEVSAARALPSPTQLEYFDALADSTVVLQKALSAAVINLSGSSERVASALLEQIVDWEVSRHARQLCEAPRVARAVVLPELTAEVFATYLNERFPGQTISISNFTVIAGGFSKLTVLVELDTEIEGCRSLVIRAMQAKPLLDLPLDTVTTEYPVVKAAWEAGTKAPRPLWLEDDDTRLGRRFMVTARAFGRNMGAADGSCEALSESVQRSLAREMAKIHQVDLGAFVAKLNPDTIGGWIPGQTMADNTREFARFWRGVFSPEKHQFSPLMERGLRWLADNVEPCDMAPTLIHGDYGLHNILIDNDEVSVVLDWELCHIGDPAEEISWFMANTDSVVDKKTFLNYYYEYGGQPVSEFRLRYFAVAHCIRMAIACFAGLDAVRKGSDNIQLAMFGLRFMHHHSSRLNRMIAEAEAVKGDW